MAYIAQLLTIMPSKSLPSSMHITLYDDSCTRLWDDFLQVSSIQHFFYSRSYLSYHKDRFKDMSLMVFDKERLVALFPACLAIEDSKQVVSHAGLSFGGIVLGDRCGQSFTVNCLDKIQQYYKTTGYSSLVYKVSPFIYHSKFCQGDHYWLWRQNAQLLKRDSASVINLDMKTKLTKGRKASIKKALKHNISIQWDNRDLLGLFWDILSSNLSEKYNTKPTHSLEEINYLIVNNPSNIRLCVSLLGDKVLAGAIVFITKKVIHTQYLSTSLEGKEIGALDLLIHDICNIYSDTHSYLSFGISTSDNSSYLNTGLSAYKESFGAGTIVYDSYKIVL